MVDWPLRRRHNKRYGQGVIEYGGALIVASMVVASVLVSGIGKNGWMYNSYTAIFSAAGNMLISAVGNL